MKLCYPLALGFPFKRGEQRLGLAQGFQHFAP